MDKSSAILNLNLDIIVELASFLSAKDLLVFSSTCTSLYKMLHKSEFWVSYANLHPKLCPLNLSNIRISNDCFYDFFRMSTAAFYSSKDHDELEMIPIDASSTDFNQNIACTLMKEKNLFWSSKGHDTTDGNEYLLYMFDKFFVVPTVVHVSFFKTNDNYLQTGLLYLSQFIQVEFSNDGRTWEFGSEKVAVKGQKCQIKILKKVGVARFMKVNFIGKVLAQATDNKFYHAVERVKCCGYQVNKEKQTFGKLNEQLLRGYYDWKIDQVNMKEDIELKPEDLLKEIQEYFETRKFSNSNAIKFENEILTSQNPDEIWNFLNQHPNLLIDDELFITIFKKNKPFVKEYLTRINNEKKRDYCYQRELIMAACDLLDGFVLDSTAVQRITSLDMQYLDLFHYHEFSIKVFAKVVDLVNVGNALALDYILKRARKTGVSKEVDCPKHALRELIYQFVAASAVFANNVANSSGPKSKKK